MSERNAEDDLAVCNAATPDWSNGLMASGNFSLDRGTTGHKVEETEYIWAPARRVGCIENPDDRKFAITARTALPYWIKKAESLRARAEKAEAECERLRRGDFTDEELQNLCHNMPEKETKAAAFIAGCRAYQEKLFGAEALNPTPAREGK